MEIRLTKPRLDMIQGRIDRLMGRPSPDYNPIIVIGFLLRKIYKHRLLKEILTKVRSEKNQGTRLPFSAFAGSESQTCLVILPGPAMAKHLPSAHQFAIGIESVMNLEKTLVGR